ncbi:hypothetical protein [Bacillus wiedmannii]|nr:hypothetical protein [Bacillus wiedmannii]
MRKESILKAFLNCVNACSNGEEEFHQFIDVAFDIEQTIKNSDE